MEKPEDHDLEAGANISNNNAQQDSTQNAATAAGAGKYYFCSLIKLIKLQVSNFG